MDDEVLCLVCGKEIGGGAICDDCEELGREEMKEVSLKASQNRSDQHHHPWGRSRRQEERHDYGGGHVGAAKGRAAHKRNIRRRERREIKSEIL